MELNVTAGSSELNNLICAPRHGADYLSPILGWTNLQPHRRRTKALSRKVERRPRGVWNSGQSCHLGASLTALSAIPLLRQWLQSQKISLESPFAILKQYLLEAACSSDLATPLDPRPVLSLLEAHGWKSRHAQDAHETMARLLEILQDRFDRETKVTTSGVAIAAKSRSYSTLCAYGRMPMTQMYTELRPARFPFSLLTGSSNYCQACRYLSPTSFQESILLTLPVPARAQTLLQSLSHMHMSSERLEMRCDSCKCVRWHTRYVRIWRMPEVLILHLQKAIYGRGGVGAPERAVHVPQRLYIPTRTGHAGRKFLESFALRSMVRHRGTRESSHFDAVLGADKGPELGVGGMTGGRCWWLVDDGRVSGCTEAALNPSLAYLVVYDMRGKVSGTSWRNTNAMTSLPISRINTLASV